MPDWPNPTPTQVTPSTRSKGLLAKLPAEGYLPVSLEPSGWEAVVGDPETRKAMKAKALAKAQTEARAAMAKNWIAENGVLTGAADGGTIGSAKNYENFELILDWKTEGEAAMGIRSIPQIALGGKNSGALTGNMLHDNAAPKAAANGPQEWNTMQVKVVSDRVTVVLNGVTTAENVILEKRMQPGDSRLRRGTDPAHRGKCAPQRPRNVHPRTARHAALRTLGGRGCRRLRGALRRYVDAPSGPGTPPTTSPSTERST